MSPYRTLDQLARRFACAAALGAALAAAHAAEPPAPFQRQGERYVVPADSPLRQQLRVAALAAQAVPQGLAVPAMVEANPARVVNVLAPLGGRVLKIGTGLDERVAQGQVLAVMASPDLAQAQSDVEKGDDALDLAKRALDRARGVEQAGGNAQKDLEAAQSAYNQALSEARRARERLRTLAGGAGAQGHEGELVVRAPLAGVVTALSSAAGSLVNDPTQPLLTITDLSRVWVTAQLPEDQVARIAPGLAVDVSLAAYPGQTLHGRVASVSPIVEPDTRRIKVRAEFANGDGRLKPNMFATAVFALPQPVRVLVPASALLMNNDSTTVFVEVAPWTFVRRAVELGADAGDKVRVISGLKAGDKVIVSGGILLND